MSSTLVHQQKENQILNTEIRISHFFIPLYITIIRCDNWMNRGGKGVEKYMYELKTVFCLVYLESLD